jgi:hypothetical protein
VEVGRITKGEGGPVEFHGAREDPLPFMCNVPPPVHRAAAGPGHARGRYPNNRTVGIRAIAVAPAGGKSRAPQLQPKVSPSFRMRRAVLRPASALNGERLPGDGADVVYGRQFFIVRGYS